MQCALCSVQCAVCSAQCAVCSVQCAVCSVQCAQEMCSLWCAVDLYIRCSVCRAQLALVRIVQGAVRSVNYNVINAYEYLHCVL